MIQTSHFRVRTSHERDEARLRLEGELDIATAPRVEAAVREALAAPARRVVIDLAPLAFVDSSGLRLFILLAERSRAEGWELALLRPGEPTIAVFRITGAEQNLPFIDGDGSG